ncbi:MAG TPA: DUF1330 domain-containing protein [Hypericibacter adhaerens]|jgi:uncharacterized protein (DUF1330 family)|uniref:DUF1330 domain-containing protein n=1 Tax=Hypericibacter adhaerens TaxID=2602016 RepID=A0A5J6MYK2_9PROT|nr:DUF1330 domain-containing protein [Hypericibacter adhaerens]QEX22187.1 hypothetical protein FRZ61_21170 [Hypericibacter adhaerens]HWA45362.1 DUF1330 domain-containing protein [Hypericibacter adhaerens]
MKAYTIGQIDITDPAAYEAYRKEVMPTITAFGGKFIVRGGTLTKLEGDWPYARAVVIEFPSREAAEGWYRSPAYQKLLPLRLKASRGNFVIVDGAE